MPLNIVGCASYNRLPEKNTGNNDSQWLLAAGLEYGVPSIIVKPYFVTDGMINFFKNEGAGPSNFTRGGLGIGAGVQFSLPAFGSFDVSAKYQILNLIGKESNEETFSQISAGVALMFSVL